MAPSHWGSRMDAKAVIFRGILLSALCALALSAARAEPDEDALGKAQGYPMGSPVNAMDKRVGNWSAMDKVPGVRTQRVARGDSVQPLPRAQQPVTIQYRYRNLGYSLDEYLERRRITGLLILKNGEIVAERYRYGRTPEARFLSFSMAKRKQELNCGRGVPALNKVGVAWVKYFCDIKS